MKEFMVLFYAEQGSYTFEPVDEIVQLYTVNNVTVALPILSAKVLFFHSSRHWQQLSEVD